MQANHSLKQLVYPIDGNWIKTFGCKLKNSVEIICQIFQEKQYDTNVDNSMQPSIVHIYYVN